MRRLDRWGEPIGQWPRTALPEASGVYQGVARPILLPFPEGMVRLRAPIRVMMSRAATCPARVTAVGSAMVEKGSLHAGEIVLVEGRWRRLFGLQLAKAHGARAIVVHAARRKRKC